MDEITASIDRYLTALDTADRQESERKQLTTARLHENIAALKVRMRELEDIRSRLKHAPDQQVSMPLPKVGLARLTSFATHAPANVNVRQEND